MSKFFGFMKNASIWVRIMVGLAAPTIGLLVFSGMMILETNTRKSEMARVERLAQLAPVVSALVHELQKERGASAVFIASKGKRFTKKLPDQRQAADKKRKQLAGAFEAFDTSAYGSTGTIITIHFPAERVLNDQAKLKGDDVKESVAQ